jgi:hypothetical protein
MGECQQSFSLTLMRLCKYGLAMDLQVQAKLQTVAKIPGGK